MDDLGTLYNTFSIVGFDPITNDLGVAVATKYIAVGSVFHLQNLKLVR